MNWTFRDVMGLVVETIKNPREGASTVLNFAPSRDAIWTMLALVVVLSVILAQLTSLMFSGGAVEQGPFAMTPLTLGLVQGGLLVIMVYATYWIGKGFGGTGSFEETMLLITWLQFILVCLQVLQTIALVVLPPFAGVIGIGALVLFFWLLVNFVAILHGFTSLGMVFVCIILSFFGVGFGLAMIVTMIGLTPGVGNV